MTLQQVVEALGLEVCCEGGGLDRQVRGAYASDLLSDVMAHAREGDLWITLQVHQNIVAVASLNDLAGVILVNGRRPEKSTVEKAETEEVPLLVSTESTFEVCGRLYALGIRGVHEAS
jgi:hypothetical protein